MSGGEKKTEIIFNFSAASGPAIVSRIYRYLSSKRKCNEKINTILEFNVVYLYTRLYRAADKDSVYK